jgi:hypothetical protein
MANALRLSELEVSIEMNGKNSVTFVAWYMTCTRSPPYRLERLYVRSPRGPVLRHWPTWGLGVKYWQ